jgi:hypothetical protein
MEGLGHKEGCLQVFGGGPLPRQPAERWNAAPQRSLCALARHEDLVPLPNKPVADDAVEHERIRHRALPILWLTPSPVEGSSPSSLSLVRAYTVAGRHASALRGSGRQTRATDMLSTQPSRAKKGTNVHAIVSEAARANPVHASQRGSMRVRRASSEGRGDEQERHRASGEAAVAERKIPTKRKGDYPLLSIFST